MLRVIITKNSNQYKSYTDLHSEIVITNKLNYSDVIQELVIDRGITYNVRRALPCQLEIARNTEALYRYGFIKEGD